MKVKIEKQYAILMMARAYNSPDGEIYIDAEACRVNARWLAANELARCPVGEGKMYLTDKGKEHFRRMMEVKWN